MTAVAQKASKTESVCDGQAGPTTSENRAKSTKKKHLHSPRLGFAFRQFFRHKVCMLLKDEGDKKSPGPHIAAHPEPTQLCSCKTEPQVVGILRGQLKISESTVNHFS